MKRILVPTDFSTYAENALKVAAIIAKKNNCEIFLLHLMELPNQMNDAVTGGSSIPELMLFKKKATEKLQKIKEQLYLNGISINISVQFDRAFSGILSFNKKNEIDLIIMGSHGTSGIEEVLIGSNTEKVVRLSEIPVLVIKKNIRDFKFNNFVFASDFSEETEKAFKKMMAFAKIFNANLHLVMICSPNSFKTTKMFAEIMKKFIAAVEIENSATHLYNDVNIENGIINFTNSINADLIGLCTHGRTGFSHFFNGSVSEDLVNHTVKPVMTFKI
jgi:nucleotide-binding universal stress UspA family protein